MESHVHACLDSSQRFSAKGIVTKNGNLEGTEHGFDVVICVTGFDTSFRSHVPVVGRDGINLQDLWADQNQVESYMSVSAAGMPNYLMYGGLSYPGAHGSLLPVSELIANYIYRHDDLQMAARAEPQMGMKPSRKNGYVPVPSATLDQFLTLNEIPPYFIEAFDTGPIRALFCTLDLGRILTLLKNPRMQDYHFEYEGNRFAFRGNGFTTRETEERDLAWYLDPKDDHHRPRLQV
ncbi:Steroid monooxygenase [Mycena venus]|uniref:Steroid monooxygenase n=1 Tax=Mycena venus TaxID=2733690 RepID=A0A8H6XEC7_9AGAR|nr:Steroid monooxygenase [Mycena venus]